ncbi:MAG: tetratricopeptide repeat-containing protein [Oligoflexales bacterium]
MVEEAKRCNFDRIGFSLIEDINKINLSYRKDIPEATIIYCTRIFEVMIAKSVELIGIIPASNVFGNLNILQRFGKLSYPHKYWFHAIRRVGNDCRHVTRKISSIDEDWAISFIREAITWSITFNNSNPDFDVLRILTKCSNRYIREFVNKKSYEDLEKKDLASLPQALIGSPILYGVLGEYNINHGNNDLALEILDIGIKLFPKDVRLIQLKALILSRKNDLIEAKKLLDPYFKKNSYKDPETQGIYCGILKRIWLNNPKRTSELRSSRNNYYTGFEKSEFADIYMGINAAALSLFLGQKRESRNIAEKVKNTIEERQKYYSLKNIVTDSSDQFWDIVTLAEANLLMGNFSKSRSLYNYAFNQYSSLKGNIEITKFQLTNILKYFPVCISVDNFLAQSQTDNEDYLSIGITGHRDLQINNELKQTVEEIFKKLGIAHRRLRIFSPLSEGTDRIIYHVAKAIDDKTELISILPTEITDYVTDFESEDSRKEFLSLIGMSEKIIFPEGLTKDILDKGNRLMSRNAAYLNAGKYVVDQSEIVIAIWDGFNSRGMGGTGDIVQYAYSINREVIWINSAPPYDLKGKPFQTAS